MNRLLLLFALFLAPGSTLAQGGESRPPEEVPLVDEETLAWTIFTDEVLVQLFTVQVRALDHDGSALAGLGPEDFKVKVGAEEARVVAVDWIPAGPRLALQSLGEDGQTLGEDGTQPGCTQPGCTPPVTSEAPRLVVFFVQASAVTHRASGLRWTLRHIDSVLDSLHPTDRVAVVVFHHHLEIRTDFTRRRRDIKRALESAILFEPSGFIPFAEAPSLAAGFDADRAFDAAFVETGLEVTADALRDLPGEKILFFLGWGLGVEHGGDATPRFRSAVRALHRADVTVSALAVGNLMGNRVSNLDASVEMVAAATGGTYAKLHPFMELAMGRLGRSLEGHYLVTFEVGAVEKTGWVEVLLREGGFRVHHRAVVLRRGVGR